MLDGDVRRRIDESGRVVEWCRSAQELFGWPADDAVGQPVAALVSEAATVEPWRRDRIEDAGPVLVKPVLTDASVVWEVRATAAAASDAMFRCVGRLSGGVCRRTRRVKCGYSLLALRFRVC